MLLECKGFAFSNAILGCFSVRLPLSSPLLSLAFDVQNIDKSFLTPPCGTGEDCPSKLKID